MPPKKSPQPPGMAATGTPEPATRTQQQTLLAHTSPVIASPIRSPMMVSPARRSPAAAALNTSAVVGSPTPSRPSSATKSTPVAASPAAANTSTSNGAVVSAPVAAADAASGSPFPARQTAAELVRNGMSPYPFMMRAIYQYLSQFGYEELADELQAEFGQRHADQANMPQFTAADVTESHLRSSMYRMFTLTAPGTPNFETAAEVLLADVMRLATLAHMPIFIHSPSFEIDRDIRILACLEADANGRHEDSFHIAVRTFFTPANTHSEAEAAAHEKRAATGARLDDIELRRNHFYYVSRKLKQYHTHRVHLQRPSTNLDSTNARQAEAFIAHYLDTHNRHALQLMVNVWLKSILEKIEMSGSTFLEDMVQAILNGRLQVDEEEEAQGEEEENEEEEVEDDAEELKTNGGDAMDEVDEAPVGEDEPMAEAEAEEEGMEPAEEEEEEVVSVRKPTASSRRAAPAAKPVKTTSSASVPKAASAAPSLAPVKNRRGRPRKHPVPHVTPEAVRQLQSASASLKDEGLDPLAAALRSTQNLSRKRRSTSDADEAEQEEDEEAVEDVQVDLEEEEEEEVEPEPTPAKKKRGRPRKQPKYDAEQEHAEKIEFDSNAGEETEEKDNGGDEEEEEDEEEQKTPLPKFKSKKRSKASSSSKASSASKSQLVPASVDAPGQRNRPVQHRHVHDRSVKRVPWTTEEQQKLTEGVLEFASARNRWACILEKYGEFFQDRTVVDLKDKWRNLSAKSGKKLAARSKVDNKITDEMEEIEE